jgi:hypothetical protein
MRTILGLAAAAAIAASGFATTGVQPMAGCTVNVGWCTTGGNCTINVGTCDAGGDCYITVGHCSKDQHDLIAL